MFDSYISSVKDILIDGKMPFMLAFPMDPLNTFTGHMYGEEYEIWPTRYIGGIDGGVLFSKTMKCNF